MGVLPYYPSDIPPNFGGSRATNVVTSGEIQTQGFLEMEYSDWSCTLQALFHAEPVLKMVDFAPCDFLRFTHFSIPT
jgi:hypothetical protein